jgi:hypothetical protein
MNNLEDSIQNLLHLQRPLPVSLSKEVRLGYQPLLRLHDEFTSLASELRVWSFYETIDSRLSGTGSTAADLTREVSFGAPLVSIKSSLLGVRQEKVYSLASDHANTASFGTGNTETMKTYLADLASAVSKAIELSDEYIHHPLNLKANVKIEIIGFYEDPDAEMESAIRLYFTKQHLTDFIDKGPERCLEERLAKMPVAVSSDSLTRVESNPNPSSTTNSGGLWTDVQELGHKLLRPRSGSDSRLEAPAEIPSPDIYVTPTATGTSISAPAAHMRRSQSLTVPPLSNPVFSAPPGGNNIKPSAMQRKSDEIEEEISPTKVSHAEAGRRKKPANLESGKSEPIPRKKPQLMSHASVIDDLTAGFSRPDPTKRKFMWIHMPFNNPPWVKVSFKQSMITEKSAQFYELSMIVL